jgi:DHA1 family multidrug resistance protein B-like MFS transporter
MISTVRRFNRDLQVRFFLHFAEKLFEGLVVPFFVIYATQRLDATYVGFGLLAVAVAAAFVSLNGGHWADGLGRRRVLLPTETVKTAALVLLTLAVWGDAGIAWVFALYFVVAALNAIAGPVGEAVTLDAAKPHEMKSVYAVLYWLTNLGRSVGTILGVVLFEWVGFEALTAICTAFSALSAWLVIARLRETRAAGAVGPVVNIFSKYRDVFTDGTMMLYVGASTLNHGIAVQLAYYIAARLAREFPDQTLFTLGTTPVVVTGVAMFGVLRLQTNLIAMFGVGPMQRVTGNVDPRLLFTVGPLIAGCAFAVMMVSNSAWVLIGAMTAYTLSEVAYQPVKQALLAQIAPADARGRYAAVRSFDFRLALIIGAGFVSLSAWFSPEVLAGAVLAMGACVAAALLAVWRRVNRAPALAES